MDQAKRLKAFEQENTRLRKKVTDHALGILIRQEKVKKNFLSRPIVGNASGIFGRLCRCRDTESAGYFGDRRHLALPSHVSEGEIGLTATINDYATRFGCYNYHHLLVLLQDDDWMANHKRIESIWRQEGLKVSQKKPRPGRLWLRFESKSTLNPGVPEENGYNE
jgi:hypothetical protein